MIISVLREIYLERQKKEKKKILFEYFYFVTSTQACQLIPKGSLLKLALHDNIHDIRVKKKKKRCK